MEALTDIANNKKYDETTRLMLSYRALKQLSKFNVVKPCIKKYLFSQVRSKFVKIDANEWDLAIFLPVQKFKKAAPSTVWSQSALKSR
jgi:endo-1,4-beta-D-glucanase Y